MYTENAPADGAAYRMVVRSLSRRRKGASVADITAATALPLERVREMLPRAADEFSGRLQVTESGEILYSFPHGFVSRYRGFGPALKRLGEKLASCLIWLGSLLFKVWIMVMLIGYFALFVALALASLFISVAAQSGSSGKRRGGSVHAGINLFDLFIRLWFYSELTRPINRDHRSGKETRPSRPLHRAIFSFVFGDADPNREWPATEKKAVIACIQARQGVISLPEFMAVTGKTSAEAEEAILSFCAKFGGSPEATEEGTIVYRFDALLLRTDHEDRSFGSFSAPLQRLGRFSENPKTMNIWFGLINTVNILFGSYFLYNAFNAGAIHSTEQLQTVSFLYGFTYALFSHFAAAPLVPIAIGLGLVPLVFSVLFWLIPGLRFFSMKKENERIKMMNLRRIGFGRIWSEPMAVQSGNIGNQADECRPKNTSAAGEQVIKEMAAYSIPEVDADAQGNTVYSFKELVREKEALEQYRGTIAGSKPAIGQIVFDSGE
ncbi:MAG: hypothetical protein LBD18_00065 [Treponema sp.]|jgi:hypothetical protein|nr:hypothetical protein [Treponema sp.]